ncbi:MAG: PQQ-binding-like beta-propeller repeat protein [Candidatus Bathyarchaeota archaeon]|nr:PQQ-binding-like beta-propeller repeat protein [Candidatus Bathyarchaeota archaeon]
MLKGTIPSGICVIILLSLLVAPCANGQLTLEDSQSENKTTELWNFSAANTTAHTVRMDWNVPMVEASPTVANRILYVVNSETYLIPNEPYHNHFGFGPPQHRIGTLYAIDVYRGAKLWNFTAKSTIRSFKVTDKDIYICGEGDLYVLDAQSGNQKWLYRSGGEIKWAAFSEDKVFVGVHGTDFNCYVYSLKEADGKVLWEFSAGWGASISYPVIRNSILCFGTFSSTNHYFSVDAATGEKRWTYNVSGKVEGSCIIEGVVYFATNDNIYALDIDSGEKVWGSSVGSSVVSAPVADRNIVYALGTAGIYAFDAKSGNEVWNYSAKYPTYFSVAQGVVYFMSNGVFYALSGSTGNQISSLQTSGHPVFSDGIVYYDFDDTIYAFNAMNGKTLWNLPHNDNQSLLAVLEDRAYFYGDHTIYAYSTPANPHSTDPTTNPSREGQNDSLETQSERLTQLLTITAVTTLIVIASTALAVWKNHSKKRKPTNI